MCLASVSEVWNISSFEKNNEKLFNLASEGHKVSAVKRKGGSTKIFGKFQTVTLEGKKWAKQWIPDQWLRQNNTFQVNIRQYLATPETQDSLISGDKNN